MQKYKYSALAQRLLGEMPHEDRIIISIGAAMIAHTIIAKILPPKGRRVWQIFWIGVETIAVRQNYKAGTRIDW